MDNLYTDNKMGFLNYEIMSVKGLSLHDVGALQLIKQNKIQDLSQEIEFEVKDSIFEEKMTNLGYIEVIKGTTKQSYYQKLRTTKNGVDLLDLISTPGVNEEQLRMRDYLIDMYLSSEDKERVVGNKKLIASYISILQNELAIDIYQFYYLCEFFLAEHIFTKKLENVFWDKNKERYKEFKNNIESSTIYQFYEQRLSDIEYYWAQKIK